MSQALGCAGFKSRYFFLGVRNISNLPKGPEAVVQQGIGRRNVTRDGMASAQRVLTMPSMKTILIVEDNADWRELITMILRRLGYEVFMAVNGEDGVQKALTIQPDLILMDLGLPKMSGEEATLRIKSNPATKDTPIVIQTAFGVEPSVDRAMKVGAVDIVHKPINITDIQAILKKHLPTASPAGLGSGCWAAEDHPGHSSFSTRCR